MGSECNGDQSYNVTIKSKEKVAAGLPLQEHRLPLSNLDLLLPPLDVGVFFCYKKTNSFKDFDAMVSELKVSLAKTLVTYYPFAGEVAVNPAGEPELLCNNRGVDFVVAYGDVELEELDLHDPDESVEKKLVPQKEEGVLCVQVTELKCGGMVISIAFDHRIVDAYSANMFLVAWAEMSTSKAHSKSPPPSFRRSLLTPRGLSPSDPCLDRLYMPVSAINPKNAAVAAAAATSVNRIYIISSTDLEDMQAKASNSGLIPKTKLESFSAYLWQLIAKGARKSCSMGIVVNGRSRFNQQMHMESYFGNVLSIPYGTMKVDKIDQMELNDIAEAVHGFIGDATTEEHFLGLVDWVEARRPEPAAARIYLDGEEGGSAFVVSSGRGFPVGEVEFGWGKAVFGSYHFPWGGSAGYVMPMPSARGNGDWVVYMHLGRELVHVIEAEGKRVLRPLTREYVMGTSTVV